MSVAAKATTRVSFPAIAPHHARRRRVVRSMSRLPLATLIVFLLAAAPASAAVRFERIPGYKSPGTPAKYDKVGILKVGSARAKNVLVLNPGTSAGAAYFAPLAKSVVARVPEWQVWAVERRENLLEDQSMFDKVKAAQATPE